MAIIFDWKKLNLVWILHQTPFLMQPLVVSLVEINQVAIHLPSKYVKHYTMSNRCKGAQDSTANWNSVTIKLIWLCHIHKHSQLCIWGCTHGSCGKLWWCKYLINSCSLKQQYTTTPPVNIFSNSLEILLILINIILQSDEFDAEIRRIYCFNEKLLFFQHAYYILYLFFFPAGSAL